MRIRHILAISSALAFLATSAPSRAVAEDAQSFVEHQHHHIEDLLPQPESQTRDTEVHDSLSRFVDYDELTHRAFGDPCPVSEPSCENLWAKYDDDKKAELRS